MSPSQTPDGQVNVLRDHARRLVDGGAPVLAQSYVVVQASLQTIWAVLTDFERWPAWNPEVTRMTLRGHLLPGTVFEWTAGRNHIRSRITAVDPPRLISWTGRTMGISARHVYLLEVLDSGATLVCTAESFDGRLARLFRRRLAANLEATLQRGLSRLAAEALGREVEGLSRADLRPESV